MRSEAFGEQRLTVESCDPRERDMRDWLQARIDAEDRKLDRLREKIIQAMASYKEEFKLDTAEVDANIAAAFEYRSMLDQLLTDDLPRLKRGSKNCLMKTQFVRWQISSHSWRVNEKRSRIVSRT